MNKLLMRLFQRPAPQKCERCKGSGLVTVTDVFWDPVVCWCGKCGGSGLAAKEGGAVGDGKGGV